MRALVVFLPILLVASAARADLHDARMEPPAALGSRASVLSATWIQLVLQENGTSDLVADPTRYAISSSDDPAFGTPARPIAVEHRHFPEDAWYATTHDAATVAEVCRALLAARLGRAAPSRFEAPRFAHHAVPVFQGDPSRCLVRGTSSATSIPTR